jgi:hypothetical protein
MSIKKDGAHYEFYPNGNLKLSTFYVSGKEHGTRREYYPGSDKSKCEKVEGGYIAGLLESAIQFVDGKIDGISCIYYPNGRISKITRWENNTECKIWHFYCSVGVLSKKVCITGPNMCEKSFSLDGTKFKVVRYKGEMLHGRQIKTDMKTGVTTKTYYCDDILQISDKCGKKAKIM